jgi:hypothetical protein
MTEAATARAEVPPLAAPGPPKLSSYLLTSTSLHITPPSRVTCFDSTVALTINERENELISCADFSALQVT